MKEGEEAVPIRGTFSVQNCHCCKFCVVYISTKCENWLILTHVSVMDEHKVGGFLRYSVHSRVSGVLTDSLALWLSVVVVGYKVTLRRAGLVLRWVTVRGIPSQYLTKPPRSTQPGYTK